MTLILAGILAAAAVASAVEVRMTEDMVGVYEQDQAVLAYRYHNTPKKPYLMEWYTPGGANGLRDAPADHLHHHGLMFAITVEDVNFWEESAGGGAQAHRGFTEMRVMPADNRRLAVIGIRPIPRSCCCSKTAASALSAPPTRGRGCCPGSRGCAVPMRATA